MTTRGQVEVPWDIEALSKAPSVFETETPQAGGVRGFFYEGLPWRGQQTRVFAWYGAPEGHRKGKLPAMVLVHGGGGTAFDRWVRLWTSRGYAAIAMDLNGRLPIWKDNAWVRHNFGGPENADVFNQIDWPLEDQWPYHAVADILLAHSLIGSFPEVDRNRTGVTGISWGGYLTCLVAGVDARFKLAAPVYGCGFLGENSGWLAAFEKVGKARADRWLRRWDPSVYLPAASMPMLWVTGTNDSAYPLDSLQGSYRLPRSSRTLCVRVRMAHGHEVGETPAEISAFADGILKHEAPLATITGQGRERQHVWAAYRSARRIVRAELNFTKDTCRWQDREWFTVQASVDTTGGKADTVLPDGVTGYYLNLIDEHDLVVSTEHEEMV